MCTNYTRQRVRAASQLPPQRQPAVNPATGRPVPFLPPLGLLVYPLLGVLAGLVALVLAGPPVDDEQLTADLYCSAVADGHIKADRAHPCPPAAQASSP